MVVGLLGLGFRVEPVDDPIKGPEYIYYLGKVQVILRKIHLWDSQGGLGGGFRGEGLRL